jgi:hypothetical protein
MKRGAGSWLVMLALALGCARAGMDAGAGSPAELGSSLNVRVAGDSVHFEVHVTNTTSSPIALEFTTAQRYDFEVSERDGDLVWRWSDGMMFAQALGREDLAPGESRRYMAGWPVPGRQGDFIATARVVSTNYPVELRTGFRLPSE